jgi:hypothetical protein
MQNHIALFGEAEKGSYSTLLHFSALPEFAETVGNPPEDSQGIQIGVQTLLFEFKLIYIRVHEEGYSAMDYYSGLRLLKEYQSTLCAICIPGVGDKELIQETFYICKSHKSLLITTERDFYDFLTNT